MKKIAPSLKNSNDLGQIEDSLKLDQVGNTHVRSFQFDVLLNLKQYCWFYLDGCC